MRDYNAPHVAPKIVLRFDRNKHNNRPCLITGRLYVGYIGVYWITPLFTFTCMILHWQKGTKP